VLNTLLDTRAVVGTTLSPLTAAGPGRFDNGPALEVRLTSGALESVTQAGLLAGGNLAAIGDGTAGGWELFQFAEALLVGPNTYHLSLRLRGQLGSDALMPPVWPAGSTFVLMNGVPSQINLPRSLRRVAQHYRVGPAQRAVDDPSYTEQILAFDGNGLRPYRPVHLRAVANSGGDQVVRWTRRTRSDGDPWDLAEVPLNEESEAYVVEIVHNGQVVRRVETTTPQWVYSAADQSADGVSGAFTVRVAQVSAVYGPGPAASAQFAVV